MKLIVLTICIVNLFLIIGLTGCEELEKLSKSDYISVTVSCWVEVYWDPVPYGTDLSDILIKVEIIKDGGERKTDLVTTDMFGRTSYVTATFNLYNQQSIAFIANVVLESAAEKFPNYTFNSGVHTLPWSHFYPKNDFGDSVTASPILISVNAVES